VRERRTLLFLDGMEPLQYPAGRLGGGKEDDAGVSGALKDKGMAVLLRELATDNPGMVIVTTRIKLRDLREFRKPAVLPIALTALAEAPAIQLLQARGVKGSQKHLAKLANNLCGHALALNLIAQYLVTHHGGDARRADLIPDLAHVGGDDERDPYRVMSAYEIELKKQIARELGLIPKWPRKVQLDRIFEPGTQTLSVKALSTAAGKQLALLYMLGLFDQPVPHEVFDALIAPPAISGLTDGIAEAQVRATQWSEAIARLRNQGLISPADADAPDTLDCHPLVREYFGQRLKQIDHTAFKAAHSRLYDHYRYAGLPATFRDPVSYALLALIATYPENAAYAKEHTSKGKIPPGAEEAVSPVLRNAEAKKITSAAALMVGAEWERALAAFLPEEEAGMTPLFAAIAHGCAAERETEAWSEVYRPRIARGNEYFSTAKLGLFGPDLGVLASFFEAPFIIPSPRLVAGRRGLVLNLAGIRLRALGRLEDAATPLRAALEGRVEEKNWKSATAVSGNLCELLGTIGRLVGEEGAVAVGAAAVRFADRSSDSSERAISRSSHANALLQVGALARADGLFRDAEVLENERLYSLRGANYCDLLLARGRASEAAVRAAYAIGVARRNHWLLDIALDSLSQARAALTVIPPPTPRDCAARSDQALAALRRANAEHHLPRGLLAHAEALWRCGDADAADELLREAKDIATLGPMPLFMTYAHLLRACIALSQNDFAAARGKHEAAAALIKKLDYGRGAVELAVLDAELAIAEKAPDADKAIAAALKAVAGEPYYDERTKRTISGGWFGLLPRLEAIIPAGHTGLAKLQAARGEYNAERDDYLRSTLAKDVPGYDPANDPIAAYLAERDAGGPA
jgi:hypothetical protein